MTLPISLKILKTFNEWWGGMTWPTISAHQPTHRPSSENNTLKRRDPRDLWPLTHLIRVMRRRITSATITCLPSFWHTYIIQRRIVTFETQIKRAGYQYHEVWYKYPNLLCNQKLWSFQKVKIALFTLLSGF